MSTEKSPTLIENIFLTSIKAWLVGKDAGTKIRGDEREMTALAAALSASKQLHEELSKDNTTVETVVKKIKAKQESARQFKKIVGIDWPL